MFVSGENCITEISIKCKLCGKVLKLKGFEYVEKHVENVNNSL
jgi:hypothetical protein